jgi:hypothetical protein
MGREGRGLRLGGCSSIGCIVRTIARRGGAARCGRLAGVYVAVAGNIGAGKSTLTRLVSERFHLTPVYEAVDENPYLTDFYRDMGGTRSTRRCSSWRRGCVSTWRRSTPASA